MSEEKNKKSAWKKIAITGLVCGLGIAAYNASGVMETCRNLVGAGIAGCFSVGALDSVYEELTGKPLFTPRVEKDEKVAETKFNKMVGGATKYITPVIGAGYVAASLATSAVKKIAKPIAGKVVSSVVKAKDSIRSMDMKSVGKKAKTGALACGSVAAAGALFCLVAPETAHGIIDYSKDLIGFAMEKPFTSLATCGVVALPVVMADELLVIVGAKSPPKPYEGNPKIPAAIVGAGMLACGVVAAGVVYEGAPEESIQIAKGALWGAKKALSWPGILVTGGVAAAGLLKFGHQVHERDVFNQSQAEVSEKSGQEVQDEQVAQGVQEKAPTEMPNKVITYVKPEISGMVR
ncbi:MAG: hypothetical protein GY804_06360 [Alphaproteobacteria bacterium]|nr:hypothetical protein [Alphaproteobacteria bacterium]